MEKCYLENAKEERLLSLYKSGLVEIEEINAAEYLDATIIPVRNTKDKNGLILGLGGVIDKNGHFIENSIIGHGYGGAYDCDYIIESEKTVVYIGSDHLAWGHFIVDVVPRLWYSMYGKDKAIVDEYILVRKEKEKKYLLPSEVEFLSCIGILDKVKVLTEPVRYKKVIIPDRAYISDIGGWRQPSKVSHYYLDCFNKVIDECLMKKPPNKNKSRKIFFSRSSLSEKHKNDSGIEIIDSFFINNGYEIIYPERISLKELIYLLHSCEKVAYLSGTLQHNMLFGPDELETICIERRPIIFRDQVDIDIIKRLSVIYVEGVYTPWPGRVCLSGMYVWTKWLDLFAKDYDLKLPDEYYLQSGYINQIYEKYLSEYIYSNEYKSMTNHLDYYFETITDNRKELKQIIPEICEVVDVDYMDSNILINEIEAQLWEHRIEYCRWEDSSSVQFIKTSITIIDYLLAQGKQSFLLYPVGVYGTIFKWVLSERYGIKPKAMFDKKLSEINDDILPLDEIVHFIDDDTAVVLTTKQTQCYEELKKHMNINKAITPYTVIDGIS